MEETLGKRIAARRKGQGLTQDRLAELLGVTAQAVSKWENDQSCPDITMLPKLAGVFGITTDELLGLERAETIHTAEVVTENREDAEPEGIHISNGDFEWILDSGKRGSSFLAIWILLTGCTMLFAKLLYADMSLWQAFWPSGLLAFGLMGLYPRFSIFRVGCTLLGGYFLLYYLGYMIGSQELLLPVFLLLFGLSLLVDSKRKSKKHGICFGPEGAHLNVNGRSYCNLGSGTFECAASFGEKHYHIHLPRLTSGSAQVSFGELEVDLTGCEEIAEDCHLDLNCSFGELELLIPRRYRAVPDSSTAFASVEVKGSPEPNAIPIAVSCKVSFGEIALRYI